MSSSSRIILFLSILIRCSQALSETMSRVAVVTGANKGIGFHIAAGLASSGLFSDVVLGCRDEARGREAVETIASLPGTPRSCRVSCRQLAIGSRESHDAFIAGMTERYGKVDVLVNNAGIAFKGSDPTPFEGQCKPTLAVNFWGTVDFTEEMLPLLRKGSDARIVNVASMAGHLGQLRSRELQRKFSSPDLTKDELFSLVEEFQRDVLSGRHTEAGWGNSNYGMSKLALIAMTKIWAREEEGDISVNCCCPGYCATDMSSHRGNRHPSEGARNALIPAMMESAPSGEYFADFGIASW